ncbi:hypothetical protein RCL_jg5311.t1 [Rhizophagus clarus]|uniref:Protein kinase domain-containing protein n=1 Tax=Rhizophagus clarus TaxID=94130 RepID=A0A8H3QR44_9GLOM|nr:hypothetical protein RCL_jg5311.t1 [Rhizophagus clarus]
MSDPLLILKGEIKRLGFVSNEKISLFGYFTGNEKNQADALSLLDDCDTDKEKRDYLRSLISQPEQPSVKRTYDQADLADNSAKICGELIQRFEIIPTKAEELQSLINRQLLRKLPVTSDEEQIYPEIKDYVCTTENERRSTIAKNISSAFTIDMKFSGNKSESMLHYPIDAMIRVPLETFNKYIGGALPIEIDRDKADSGTTTIGTKRPDFLCWTKKLLLFKGEEKASSGEFNAAVEELEEKFNVLDPICFGKIQFMIGYAIAGSTVRFYAIDGSVEAKKKPSILSPLTSELNASNLVDRFTILRTVVNIARIILTISDNIPNTLIPLGKRQKLGHSFITFLSDVVEKIILKVDLPYATNLDNRVNFLKKMYDYAKGHPGLVQVEKGPLFDKGKGIYRVVMKTRGIPCVSELKNENNVREMMKCILTGLARLHQGNFVHRDIRLPNVVYVPESPDKFNYVLIDFEHGFYNRRACNEKLSGYDDNTLTTAGYYTTTSDMYQLGKMLEALSSRISSDQGRGFVEELKSKKLTAELALKHSWINHSS